LTLPDDPLYDARCPGSFNLEKSGLRAHAAFYAVKGLVSGYPGDEHHPVSIATARLKPGGTSFIRVEIDFRLWEYCFKYARCSPNRLSVKAIKKNPIFDT
jgi:hypothetical protein